MSAYHIKFSFLECDENGIIKKEAKNLEKIKKNLETSFNDIFSDSNTIAGFFDEPLKSIIDKCHLKCYEGKGKKEHGYGIVTVTLKPHNFLSEKRKNLINNWFDAQMSDGWGEGIFWPCALDNEGSIYIY